MEININTANRDLYVRWPSEQGRAQWIEPEPFVIDTIARLKARGVETVLDLGCGVGRHALLLAKTGFQVYAVDASQTAIGYVGRQAAVYDLEMQVKHAEMTRIPYKNETFDYILAWNVIYHGDLSVVLQSVAEILRTLKPGGLFQGTMLSKRNVEITFGRCIAKDTYINTDRFEKRHPHFYCNAGELLTIMNGFEPLILKDVEHQRKGSYHWHFLLEKT